MCRGLRVTYKIDFGLDVWIYWHLIQYSELQRYRYSHTLQFTITHATDLSVFIVRILATDFHTVLILVSLQLQHTWSLLCTVYLRSFHFFSIASDRHLQNLAQFLTTLSNDLLGPLLVSQQALCRKHSFPIVEKACLLIRCLAMSILLWCAYASARICLPNYCLAMGLYVRIIVNAVQRDSICRYLFPLHILVSRPSSEGIRSHVQELLLQIT
jgi:hypothetical protein